MRHVRKVIGIIFIIAGVVFSIAAFKYYSKYKAGNDEYKKIEKDATKEDKDGFEVDWKKLSKKYPDIVAWIKVGKASYPVVQGKTTEYYLHKSPNKTYNINGSIFIHPDNKANLTDQNTLIYGHNMNNGSMFGSNKKYKEKKYLKKHPTFRIYTRNGRYIYRIFNIETVPDGSKSYHTQFKDSAAYRKYLDSVVKNRIYKMNVDVPDNRKIVTLSTCNANGMQRFVIQGYLEEVKDYKSVIKKRTAEESSLDYKYPVVEETQPTNGEEDVNENIENKQIVTEK